MASSIDPVGAATLVALLRARAETMPDAPLFTFLDSDGPETHLTPGALDTRARGIAARLQAVGAIGERVLLLYPPGLEYIAAFFGCLYAGAVAVPAYPPNPARLDRTLPRLRTMATNAGARLALTNALIRSLAGAVFELAPDLGALRWLATDGGGEDPDAWREPPLSGDTLAFLQYTSGSTGAPRGVMLSHTNLLANLALIHAAFEIRPDDVGCSWLPPYHDMGLIGGILEPIYAGVPCVLMSPVTFLQRPLRWLQAIADYGATVSGGPNFAYDLAMRKATPEQIAGLDLSRWTLAFNGAEPVRAETIERFSAAFAPAGFRREAFYPCYGLAEAALIVTGGRRAAPPAVRTFTGAALDAGQAADAAPDAPGARRLVGCGHIRAGQRLLIANPDTGEPCLDGQVGEVWAAGPSVAGGYWARPEDTERTFAARTAAGDGPFLRTGDLGFLRDGELFVTGRLKDLIIIDGRNHYPQDIEQTVETCHPALRPGCSAAFSIEQGGAERLVVAAEVERSFLTAQRRGANGDPDTEHQAVVAAIRRAVADAHDLRVHAVALLKTGTIPKTSSGKIQRHACRAGFLDGSLETLES